MIKPIKTQSFFLFGARGVGKTTFLKDTFRDQRVLNFDLLDPEVEEQFSLEPQRFREQVLQNVSNVDWVVVDEVQKCPKILNIVHKLIESEKVRFALTGSSARRLKQKGVNLLAGRALRTMLRLISSLSVRVKNSR